MKENNSKKQNREKSLSKTSKPSLKLKKKQQQKNFKTPEVIRTVEELLNKARLIYEEKVS